MSLTAPFTVAVVTLLALALLVASVDGRGPRWRRVIVPVGATLVIVGLLAAGHAYLGWVRYPFPAAYYAWVALPVVAVCRLGVGIGSALVRGARAPGAPRPGWWRVTSAVVAVPVALAAVAIKVNADFDYYPTVASLVAPPADRAAFAGLSLRHDRAEQGRTGSASVAWTTTPRPTSSSASDRPIGVASGGRAFEVSIPGVVSHFHARPAWIWVPPAYLADPSLELPVVMLLTGSPSETLDWLRGGRAGVTAAAWAAAHHGIAPVLVMPDENGAVTTDTECVNSRLGNAETYLTVDVPAFVHRELGVPTHRTWIVAGLSEGGTCAVMLGLRHPDLFAAFADYSGLTGPTPTDAVDPLLSARTYFGGDLQSFDSHDPLWLLVHGPPRQVAGVWMTGADDSPSVVAQRTLVTLARQAGLETWARVEPGGRHSFRFWAQAFATTLPVLLSDIVPGRPGG